MATSQYIRELLRRDAVEEAIRELRLLELEIKSESSPHTVLLSAAYERFRNRMSQRLLSQEDADIAKNNLIDQILSALSRLDNERVQGSVLDVGVPRSVTKVSRGKDVDEKIVEGEFVSGGRKKVFISYSSKDRSSASAVKEALKNENLDVWMDNDSVNPGDSISSAIMEGLTESDYFVLLISENSNQSNWVKREIATAFELSNTKNLSVIPVMIAKTEVPLEFRGLLFVDASRSLEDGLKTLVDFFRSQRATIANLEKRVSVRKSADETSLRWRECQDQLRKLSLSDLRYELSTKLTLTDVKVLWFDIFHARMDDEVQIQNVSLCCVELLDRSRRESLLAELIDRICRNHPRLSTR
jgi:hypothetical protein